MPVHEVHALTNGFGALHARQASPKRPQVDFQNILLTVLQCCTSEEGLNKYRQSKRTERSRKGKRDACHVTCRITGFMHNSLGNTHCMSKASTVFKTGLAAANGLVSHKLQFDI